MGRKMTVPYGLYRCHGFVSPHLGKDTGFTDADLVLVWKALVRMFEQDRTDFGTGGSSTVNPNRRFASSITSRP